MKKTIIIIGVLVAVLAAGFLNSMEFQTDEVENVTVEHVYMDQFPDPMLDVIMDPMTAFPLF